MNSVSASKQLRSVFGAGQVAVGVNVTMDPVMLSVPSTGALSEARSTWMEEVALPRATSREKMKRT